MLFIVLNTTSGIYDRCRCPEFFSMLVLSSTVGLELQQQGYAALSNFILKIDYWFDLLNTNLYDHKRKLKPHMAPYSTVDDERLEWLRSFSGE